MSQEKLQAAIDQLGNLDYDTRTNASRTVRRTAGAQAVPALLTAVSSHKDGYVRYRALVLLTGFDDPRTRDAIRESLASPNDRLRTVAYSYFEHNPDPSMIAPFLAALDKEQSPSSSGRRSFARSPRSATIRASSLYWCARAAAAKTSSEAR